MNAIAAAGTEGSASAASAIGRCVAAASCDSAAGTSAANCEIEFLDAGAEAFAFTFGLKRTSVNNVSHP